MSVVHGQASTVPSSDTASDQSIDPRSLQAGQVIDGFRLIERLHQGGMASLWRVAAEADGAGGAVDVEASGASAASGVAPPPDAIAADAPLPLLMKVPRYKGGEDPATIVGFEQESMIMPMLSGPHVPRFVAKGDFTRLPYIVMEHIPGESLRPRLDEAPLDLDEIVEIGSRVATALHDLHRQHVVHLDVKPSNVLMRADGTVVLIDYGLSRHDMLPDLLEEEFRLPMGTGPYMSPEQVRFVRNDPRSDQFALGVMLYHLTTGQRPFGAPQSVHGLRRRLYVDPVPPRTLRPDCPPWLQEVLLRCLEVKPDARYASAAQLALALQDPKQIALSARAHRHSRRGWMSRARRWFHSLGGDAEASAQPLAAQLRGARIVLVALDVEAGPGALMDELRNAAAALLRLQPDARLACVSVRRTARIGIDERLDEQGRSLHVKQLVALKHWARPLVRGLAMAEGRLTFHVLEAPDAAAAILEFAQRLNVDHIVIGARGASRIRRYLGSTSTEVVANAECSVTVVRAAQRQPGAMPTPGAQG